MESIGGNILSYDGKIQDTVTNLYQYLSSVPFTGSLVATIDEDNQLMYVVNRVSATLNVVDINTWSVLTTVSLDAYGYQAITTNNYPIIHISSLEFDTVNKDRLYLANAVTQTVYVISTDDFSVIASISVPNLRRSQPQNEGGYGSVFTGKYLFIAQQEYSGSGGAFLIRIRLSDYKVDNLQLAINPIGAGAITISFIKESNIIFFTIGSGTMVSGGNTKLIDVESLSTTNDNIPLQNLGGIYYGSRYLEQIKDVLVIGRVYDQNNHVEFNTVYNLTMSSAFNTFLPTGDGVVNSGQVVWNCILINKNFVYFLGQSKIDIYKIR